MAISAPGAGSGLDIHSLVQQLIAAERAPAEQRLARMESETRAQISAFGQLQSALSKLESVLEKFEDNGAQLGRKATVAEGAGFTASADGTAALGSYQIEVAAIATTHTWHSAAVALNADGTRAQVGYGTLTITLGDSDPVAVNIASGAGTLADIRDAINDQAGSLGVTATLVKGDAGEVLVLSSNRSGTDSTLSVAASGGDGGLGVLDTSTGTMTQKSAAADGTIYIDGIQRTVSSNTVTDAIEGVTLQLATAKPGETFKLEIASDPAALKTEMEAFVSAYNAAVTQLRTQTDPGAEGRAAGALRGDAASRGILQALRNAIGEHYADASLLGLKTATDGTLTLDSAKFEAKVSADPGALSRLLGDEDGLGQRLKDAIATYIGDDGVFETRTDTLNDRLERIEDDRAALDRRMADVEKRLRAQYTAMDTLIAQLNATSQFLAQRLQ